MSLASQPTVLLLWEHEPSITMNSTGYQPLNDIKCIFFNCCNLIFMLHDMVHVTQLLQLIHGGCWCLSSCVVPGHLQSWWCRLVSAHQTCHNNGQTLSIVIQYMLTSSNENIFRITGPLCGEFPGHWRIPLEFPGHWWIPLTKASNADLWCFLLSAPEQTVG